MVKVKERNKLTLAKHEIKQNYLTQLTKRGKKLIHIDISGSISFIHGYSR